MKIRKKSDLEKELVKLQQRIIELEKSETQGKLAELENVLNTSPIHIASIDISGKYTSWNKASEDMFGFTAQEVIGILTPRRFHCNDKEAKAVIDTVDREGKFDDEITLIRKDGSEFPAQLLVSKTIDSSGIHLGYSGVAVDISERKQSEKIQLVLSYIANAVNTTKNLDELYKIIHKQLGKVIDTTNFYIALYDEDKNVIAFPYYIDEKDAKPEPVPKKLSKGLTEYVIRTSKSLLAPKEYYIKLAKEGKIEISGSISEVWLGIPLRIEKKVIGVMAVQSYKYASIYNEKDVEILELVSYHIAIAIERKQAEEALKESEDRYRNIFDLMPNPVIIHSEGKIVAGNKAALKFSKVENHEEFIGSPVINFVHPDYREKVAKRIWKIIKGKGPANLIEEKFINAKNEIRDVEVAAIPTKFGVNDSVLVAFRDITERKQAEESLTLFRSLMEQSNDAVEVVNPETARFLDANEKACAELGYTRDEFLSLKIHDIDPIVDKSAFPKVMAELRKSGSMMLESLHHRKDGTTFPVELSLRYVQLGRDYVVTIVRDITERKRAEETIRESEEKYRNLVERASDGIIVIQDGIIKFANQQLVKIWGGTTEEIIGTLFTNHLHAGSKEELIERYRRRMAGEEVPAMYETELQRKDGSKLYAELNAGITLYEGKSADFVIIRDITDRKKAEEELQRSEEQFRLFAENVPGVVSIYQWHPDGHREYIYQGPGLKDIIGEELAKKIDIAPDEYFKLIPEGDFKALDEASLKSLETNKNLDFEYRLKIDDSNIKWVRALFSMTTQENGVILWQGIIYDITERKKAEKIQQTLYNISNAINTTDNMHLLCQNVREFLGNVIDTKNFYIALYDEKTDVISLPFEVDEKDKYKSFPAGKSLTKYVIQLEKPLFAPRKLQDELTEQGEIDIVGTPSEIWLGAPLKVENSVIGVIAVQSYDDPNLYTEKDLEMLTFISEEIALAIRHKQSEEDLKNAHEELQKRLHDLEIFHNATMGREVRIIELKQQVNELLVQLGKKKKYNE